MVIHEVVVIKNRLGLHARPAALFVQIANRFKCHIHVRKGRQKVNGKSIMGIMMLAAGKGSRVHITCDGHDAARAVKALQKLLSKDLDKNTH